MYICPKIGNMTDELTGRIQEKKILNHIAIIRALGRHYMGITRQKLAETAKLPEGGALTKVLDELVYSGFITIWQSFRVNTYYTTPQAHCSPLLNKSQSFFQAHSAQSYRSRIGTTKNI